MLIINKPTCNPINVILAGNPNVGKSTLFNMLTNKNEHTGNWTGKTIEIAKGKCIHNKEIFNIMDLPGTYSINEFSPEEKITCNKIRSTDYDVVVIVVNATTLDRNLILALQILSYTQKAILCLNMMDDAEKKSVYIDIDELSLQLGIPVVPMVAKSKKYKSELLDTIHRIAIEETKTYRLIKLQELVNSELSYDEFIKSLTKISETIVDQSVKKESSPYTKKDEFWDKLFTSKVTGIPVMLLVFLLIFWLTAYGANLPGEILSRIFDNLITVTRNSLVSLSVPMSIVRLIADGILTTTAWVVSVMLPPALIFFPLFSLLEESGFLPRIAFNLDRIFSKTGTNGKAAITMLMGFGCNTCGIIGCRIIRSDKERFIATVTNSFIPCNGRLPTLISLIGIFFTGYFSGIFKSLITSLILLLFLILSVFLSMLISLVISKIQKNNEAKDFIIELPSYKKPQFIKTIFNSLREKVVFTLSRAVLISIPAGAIIWLLANTEIDSTPIINFMTEFLDPIGLIMGLDGVVLTAFILGFPANEIVIPIILMTYLKNGMLTELSSVNQLGVVLSANGWTVTTALCACIFCLFHFPCSTTCLTVKKETNSVKCVFYSIIIPLITGTSLCIIVSMISKCVNAFHTFF